MERMGGFFLKINIVSMLYALMIAIPIQLMLNVYRIIRLTDGVLIPLILYHLLLSSADLSIALFSLLI